MTENLSVTTTCLAELLASQTTKNTSRMHGVMIKHAADPSDAVMYALDVIRGGEPVERRESIAGLQARIDRLANASTVDAQRELAAHCVMLEELFALYTIQALESRNIEFRIRLQKLALQAQSAHARTLALLAMLAAQSRERASILVHDDGGQSGSAE